MEENLCAREAWQSVNYSFHALGIYGVMYLNKVVLAYVSSYN